MNKDINEFPLFQAAGVLRYNRESDHPRVNLATVLSEPPPTAADIITCEYCGERVKPSLDAWLQEPETAPPFCCSQRQQLCVAVVRQTCLFEGNQRFHVKGVSLDKDTATAEVKKLFLQGRKLYNHKCLVDTAGGYGLQPEVKTPKGRSVRVPAAEACGPTTFRSFRLSCSSENGFWTVCPVRKNKRSSTVKVKEAQALVPVGGHETFRFGICHRPERADFFQKYYSSGVKFLTVFPDGSAQCFYPSGLLALVVVVTEGNERVCIVYDDSNVSERSIRAVFQSDGRATCYHSSGNIWLSLTQTWGQCLDEVGARVRRWTWSSLTRTPLRPVFLSLNRTVGVRVLGLKQVFVSFLAQGKQAKFNVGACCAPDKPQRPVSHTKEEQFVLAARMRIHMTIQKWHQCLQTPSCPRLPRRAALTHHRLQDASGHVTMSDCERAFVHESLESRL